MPDRPKQAKQEQQNRPTRARPGEGTGQSNPGMQRDRRIAPSRHPESGRKSAGREERQSPQEHEEDRRYGRQRDREDDDARDQEIQTRRPRGE